MGNAKSIGFLHHHRRGWRMGFPYPRDLQVHRIMSEAIPINDQTWLICGGRDFANQEMFDSAMEGLVRRQGMPKRVINGGAKGADLMARKWAEGHALESRTVSANWKSQGKAAGVIRNQGMLTWYQPDLVVAFPGGKGTADMVKRSHDAGVDVAMIVPS